jgi:hypothetical protein
MQRGALNAAKEKMLSDDLNAKALKIEEVKRDAATANLRAEELARENLEIKGTIDRSTAETLLREEAGGRLNFF